jgi:hypothetical protein
LALGYHDEANEIAHLRPASGQLFELYGPGNRQRKDKYLHFNGPALDLQVEDVRAARQAMLARGVEFIAEVETYEADAWAYFLGPEGRLFTIQQAEHRSSQSAGPLLGFSRASLPAHDLTGAVRFFSEVMEMALAREDQADEAAIFGLGGVTCSKPWAQAIREPALRRTSCWRSTSKT